MADKISGLNSGLDITKTRAKQTEQVQRESEAPSRASSDDVKLTDTAIRMQKLEAQLAETPEVDQSRVDAVKEKLQSGSYSMDPQRVADRLMQIERDLGKR